MRLLARGTWPLLVALIAAGAASGCGSTTFTAEELVAEMNENGGALELGEPLGSSDAGTEVTTLRFTDPTGEQPRDVHAGGSLLITEDDDAALAEFERCEDAASLICFRAANAVLIFEDSVPRADLTRIERAVRGLADE